MAGFGEELNIIDINRITLKNGRMAKVYDMITENTPIIRALMMVQCASGSTFEHAELTGLPETYYAALGQGYPKSKATTKIVRDVCGKHGGRFEATRDRVQQLANGDIPNFLSFQEMTLMKSAMESIEETIVYGTSLDTDEFIGIEARLSTPSADRTDSGYNIINGGGTGGGSVYTSIIAINHGTETFHGIYPAGGTTGMQIDRWDNFPLTDANDADRELTGYKRIIEQILGIAIPDWHGIVRGCNIQTSALTKNAATGADLVNVFIKMAMRINRVKSGTKRFYCNENIYSYLTQQASSSVGGNMGFTQVQGSEQIAFWGIPIEICHAITNTEAEVIGTFANL
jgi:hypothetical protein